MKIFLPFAVKSIGGTSSFALKFKQGMEEAGHTVSLEPCDDYDILFLIVQCPLRYLIDAKRRRKKIVQRLDGTYYWSVSGWRFPFLNAKAAYIRHFFTDYTIYQSHYSQLSAEHFLGRKPTEAASIIYNGVDLQHFSPTGPQHPRLKKNSGQVFFTASAFRRADQILPILEALKVYRQKYTSRFELWVAGSFSGPVKSIPDTVSDRGVRFLGPIKNADLPEYERASDVFLFTHLNPPCPNNVIEALACGLPICGVADGAMPELIEPGKTGRLIEASGSAFWRPRTFTPEAFADNLAQLLKERASFGRASRRAAERRFSLATMIDQYIKVFSGLVE